MILWEATQEDIKIQFIYLKRTKVYKIKIKRDGYKQEEVFKPSRIPEDGIMDLKDLDKATRIANKLYRSFKREK